MRRTAAVVALICCGLAACGGGGDGGSPGAPSGGSGKGGPDGSAAEVEPAGVVDASVCPPLDEVAQRAGEDLGLTYAVDVDGELDCTYMSEDGDLRVMVHCEDYESVEAAVEDIDIRRTSVPGTAPYDGVAGEEGVIQDMQLSDPALETMGYRTIVRQGARICQSLWASDQAPETDQGAGLRQLLDYLMVTVVA
jgi:hypothetical protein